MSLDNEGFSSEIDINEINNENENEENEVSL
jgi:hypothetical protein